MQLVIVGVLGIVLLILWEVQSWTRKRDACRKALVRFSESLNIPVSDPLRQSIVRRVFTEPSIAAEWSLLRQLHERRMRIIACRIVVLNERLLRMLSTTVVKTRRVRAVQILASETRAKIDILASKFDDLYRMGDAIGMQVYKLDHFLLTVQRKRRHLPRKQDVLELNKEKRIADMAKLRDEQEQLKLGRIAATESQKTTISPTSDLTVN